MKHEFTEPFHSQFIRALKGYSPWKSKLEEFYTPIPPSEKQLKYLTALGYRGTKPDSMREASKLIEELKL